MYFGAAYYPEHWEETRWETDATLMEEAGFNVVRIGEFAWTKFERYEGEFDFSWIDKVIDILGKHNIKAIIGTPTAAPPKWLMDKYPSIYMHDNKGIVRGFGSRRRDEGTNMALKSTTTQKPAEQVIKDIRRVTRRHFSAEDKIRIVLDGLRGEDSIAELCRKEGIAQSLYYTWSKEFMEAGKRRLAGDTTRAAPTDEVKDLRREAGALKEVVADLTLENRLLKKA